MADALESAVVIAWVNIGAYEGWQPTVFASEAEAVEWIGSGGSHGSRFVLTAGPLTLTLAAGASRSPGKGGQG